MNEIEYPERNSEAEIEAILWTRLRKKQIDARLQVTAFNQHSGKKSLKLDLVVFFNKRAICIVECKSWSKNYGKVARYRLDNTRQLRRYRELFRLPVIVCSSKQSVLPTIQQIQLIIEQAH